MNIGAKIKELRTRQHISAEEIARYVSCSPATIYRYENGDIEKVPASVLEGIAGRLGVPVQELLSSLWAQDGEGGYMWRRFRPISTDPEKLDRLHALVTEKDLSREDLALILTTIVINPDIPLGDWYDPAKQGSGRPGGAQR